MANELTHTDIDLLMEGLESIEKAAAATEGMTMMMGTVLGSLAMKDDPEGMEKYKREQQVARDKQRAERRRKQEDVYLLRAKLVQVRRGLDGEVADRIIAEATS